MHPDFAHMPCDQFAKELASKSSVPGGGGASAYVGALGVALAQMVCQFTIGKERYADVEGDIVHINAQAEEMRKRLVELVDEDASSFEPLSEAYAIPKDDPTRTECLEEATKGAIRCPMEVMRLSCKAIELLEEVQVKGSIMLLSDVGCGATFCRAALEAGAMNVLVNTSALHRSPFAQEIERECTAMLTEYVPRANAVVLSIENSFKKS